MICSHSGNLWMISVAGEAVGVGLTDQWPPWGGGEIKRWFHVAAEIV